MKDDKLLGCVCTQVRYRADIGITVPFIVSFLVDIDSDMHILIQYPWIQLKDRCYTLDLDICWILMDTTKRQKERCYTLDLDTLCKCQKYIRLDEFVFL